MIQGCRQAAAEIRHLSYTGPVHLEFREQEQLETAVGNHVERLAAIPGWDILEAVLLEFGLIPNGFDLRTFWKSLQSEQMAGYFSPRRNAIVVIEKPDPSRSSNPGTLAPEAGHLDQTDLDALRKAMLVHEFVHGLQFQNLGALNDFRRELADTAFLDDALMARKALLEGDATFVATQYLLGVDQDLSCLLGVGKRIAEMQAEARSCWNSVLVSGPLVFRDRFLFPYLDGMDFVARLLREHGWDLVNAAYQWPPVSTEQILHPSRYLEGDLPMSVTMGDLSCLRDLGYRVLSSGRWGELGVRTIVANARCRECAGVAAAGWGGDRFVVLENGTERLVVWGIAWDSAAGADEFTRAWRAGDAVPNAFPPAYSLAREGNLTLLVWGTYPDLDNLSTTLCDGVEVKTFPPSPPPFVPSMPE